MNNLFDKQSNTIYHYTDINALINIVRSDCIVLRATNCLYLNDSNEIVEGAKAIQRVMNKKIEPFGFQGYYLTSFSRFSDQLNMWGMYASNGSGCAIGFDSKILKECYEMAINCIYGEEEIDKNISSFLELTKNGSLTDIGPNHEEAQKTINRISDDLRKYIEINILVSSCIGAKNKAYVNEGEIRFVMQTNECQDIKYRTKNGIIIPYIEIEIPKEALKSIVVGPTNNSELSLQSIIHFLSINGYEKNQVKVQSSQIPYRG